MRCPACQQDNKDNAKNCRKCGAELVVAPAWRPTWAWHLKVLGVIYVVLVVLYFGISRFLARVQPPYRMREVPQDVTPWIKK